VPAIAFIVVLLIGVFAFDIGKRWWHENESRRRWRRKDRDDDS
jgi:hypothetical protein